LLKIGGYFTILRDGKLVAEAPAQDVSLSWIVEKMVGRKPESLFSRDEHKANEELLHVENLTLPRVGGGFLLDRVSFSLRLGEILGIYGLLGAGRSELLESLRGCIPLRDEFVWWEKNLIAKSLSTFCTLLTFLGEQLRIVQKLRGLFYVKLSSISQTLRRDALLPHRA
jgi:ABC-type sugar transport system ATPase subunit